MNRSESRRIIKLRGAFFAARTLVAVVCLLQLASACFSADYQVLHNFASGTEGKEPLAGVVVVGNTVYGTTIAGGTPPLVNGYGTLFKVDVNGSHFSTLHVFSAAVTDGNNPWGGLTVSGQTLYGTTENGGANNKGAVFNINLDGSSFSLVHSFNGTDGAAPVANLVVNGSTLIGTTGTGGTSNNGTFFTMNVDGSNFASRHSFDGAVGGQYPYSSLTLSGSTVYGTTLQGGGGNSIGTIFSSNLDGTSFHTLHSFSTPFPQGYDPYDYGGLTLVGSKLYGTAYLGGNNSQDGVLFSINTDGTNYHIVHTFAGGTDGSNPYAGLTLVGHTIYGSTTYGGPNNDGTLFRLNDDGTGYQTLFSFSGVNGAAPFGPLTYSDGKLYGTTSAGGSLNYGTVFSYSVPEPSTLAGMMIGVGCVVVARFVNSRKRTTSASRRL